MSTRDINFHDKKFNKSNFYNNKNPFIIDYIDVNKILVSKNKIYTKKSSLKYFIRYNDNDVIRPLCIKLPQIIGCIKCFDNVKSMCFKVIDKGL